MTRTACKGLWLVGALLVSSLACNWPAQPTPAPATPTAAPPSPLPTASPAATVTPIPPDTGWIPLAAGLERRSLRLTGPEGSVIEVVALLRIDPTSYRFEVAYAPQAPRTVQQWADETGAAITVNAGYFTPEYEATGLLVADGIRYGTSYGGFAGMVAIDPTIQPAGIEIRWLSQQPYYPDQLLQAAVQSFPVLVRPGRVLGYPEEDGIPARRTVIAQDRAGRIVIVVCPTGTITLHRLARFLLDSDLDLHIALNLDGGTSTGIAVRLGGEAIDIPSYVPVPAVITVWPR